MYRHLVLCSTVDTANMLLKALYEDFGYSELESETMVNLLFSREAIQCAMPRMCWVAVIETELPFYQFFNKEARSHIAYGVTVNYSKRHGYEVHCKNVEWVPNPKALAHIAIYRAPSQLDYQPKTGKPSLDGLLPAVLNSFVVDERGVLEIEDDMDISRLTDLFEEYGIYLPQAVDNDLDYALRDRPTSRKYTAKEIVRWATKRAPLFAMLDSGLLLSKFAYAVYVNNGCPIPSGFGNRTKLLIGSGNLKLAAVNKWFNGPEIHDLSLDRSKIKTYLRSASEKPVPLSKLFNMIVDSSKLSRSRELLPMRPITHAEVIQNDETKSWYLVTGHHPEEVCDRNVGLDDTHFPRNFVRLTLNSVDSEDVQYKMFGSKREAEAALVRHYANEATLLED